MGNIVYFIACYKVREILHEYIRMLTMAMVTYAIGNCVTGNISWSPGAGVSQLFRNEPDVKYFRIHKPWSLSQLSQYETHLYDLFIKI